MDFNVTGLDDGTGLDDWIGLDDGIGWWGGIRIDWIELDWIRLDWMGWDGTGLLDLMSYSTATVIWQLQVFMVKEDWECYFSHMRASG